MSLDSQCESLDWLRATAPFLPTFVESHNLRFAKAPRRADDLHRSLNLGPDRLRQVLCCKETRYVGRQLTLRHERRIVTLQPSKLTADLVRCASVTPEDDGALSPHGSHRA